jgi:hypothetical protein
MGESIKKQAKPVRFFQKILAYNHLFLNKTVPGVTLKDETASTHFGHEKKYSEKSKNPELVFPTEIKMKQPLKEIKVVK